ncbi:MAG: citrate synthase [Acidobacteriota bacterium]
MLSTGSTDLHSAPAALRPGLEGVVLSETHLSEVDGDAGRLVLGGFPLEELVGRASFEEVVALLWTGSVSAGGLLREELSAHRELSEATLELIDRAVAGGSRAIDVLRLALDSLSLDPAVARAARGDALAPAPLILAKLPGIVAAEARRRRSLEPLPPRPELGLAADFLARHDGEKPSAARVRALEDYLIAVIDHGLNASTFAARVVTSTAADLVSALVAAVGALSGPLHGGAPGPALDLVREIGSPDRAETVLRRKLRAGERLMGFGHRVYRVRDPRAAALAAAADRLADSVGDRTLVDLVRHVEEVAVELLDERKPDRRLRANVELYTALLLDSLGLDTDTFTPVFAMARAAGWIAHCREQAEGGRLIRPRLRYAGPRDRRFGTAPARSAGSAI